tara:strand:- start:330 stop:593 length:264 start_codon:yes stop_codon:yes gene_type:complete
MIDIIDMFELGQMELVVVNPNRIMYQTEVQELDGDPKITLISRPAHEFIMTTGAAWACPKEAIRSTRETLTAHFFAIEEGPTIHDCH